jgi:DNA-binding CsgD family transcriptional regulator
VATSLDPLQRSKLLGRRSECETLDRLVTDVVSGRSRAIVLRGDAGVGKTAVLRYLSDRVASWHVATAVGVESEMELAYSGLHQLCAHMLDHLERLPGPQRDALATTFGLSAGPPPDRFLVGLATLTLFAEVAEQRPLVCIVDDAQWLDQASALILGFVARRLLAERVGLVCAARTGSGDEVLVGLPELRVHGLADDDARALLLDNLHAPLDAAVREQIVAESHGNPLALLELPRTWTTAELAGGFGLPDSHDHPVVSRIEKSYARRLAQLPADTQLLAVAAAAEPIGDPVLLHRAAATLGLAMAAADAAEDAGLLKVGRRVEFAHPLVRSAVYHSAVIDDRHRVHRALAEATDADKDPDRRAWHRARATAGPNEEVAADLERSAGRAQARGGIAAAAAFLQRTVALTADPARRAERALAAAQASLQAGEFADALGLVATAEAGALEEFQRARADLVRGHVAFASGLGRDAPPLLLAAARRLEAFDLELARETYLTAWGAGVFASSAGGGVFLEICGAVQALPSPPGAPRPLDLLLDGLALLTIDGHAAATPTLQRAVKALVDIPVEDVLRWGWAATGASDAVWDDESTRTIAARQVQLVRDAGALAELPIHLAALGLAKAWIGDFAGAASLVAESDSVAAATGSPIAPYTLLRLRALEGSEAEASAPIASAIDRAAAGGQEIAAAWANWSAAVLYNGLAHYEEAAAAAWRATSTAFEPWASTWALPELVEAAARAGDMELARNALERLAGTTQPSGTDFALGIEARSRALLNDGTTAEQSYREAIERLGRTQLRPELARAHLLYGEWLRREGRRIDAREQLRTAHELLTSIGMQAFAERARRELLATGVKVRRRSDETRDQLTPQEEQIARLARDGLSNAEVGAQLFISARTVEWHLRKVFTKLGISSRRELRTVLPADGRLLASA